MRKVTSNILLFLITMGLIATSAISIIPSQNTSAASIIVGCSTWFSGNSTYAKCGSYDKDGQRITSYNAFSMCQPAWGGGLVYRPGNSVRPYTTSKANCAWYERPVSAGVSIR